MFIIISLALNRNLKKLTSHYLVEINFPFYFNIIGVTETKITKSNEIICTPKISGYNFEHVLTPLASGGAGLFIDGTLNYAVIEKHLKKMLNLLLIDSAVLH